MTSTFAMPSADTPPVNDENRITSIHEIIETASDLLLNASNKLNQLDDPLSAALLGHDAVLLQLIGTQINPSTPNQEDSLRNVSVNEKSILLDEIRLLVTETPDVAPLEEVIGMNEAKQAILKAVAMPMEFPESFLGRNALKSIFLLFGLPGGGKTNLAKAIAYEAHRLYGFKFMKINSSAILSKWNSESEKGANAVFDVAIENKPCVLFIDEIEQLLSTRDVDTSSSSSDCSNRVKSMFLERLWGDLSKIIVIGCTNVPWSIDSAIMSRFAGVFHVPLPNENERRGILLNEMKEMKNNINPDELKKLVKMTEGYSGRDLHKLVSKAWIEVHYTATNTTLHSFIELTYCGLCEAARTTPSSVKEKDVAKLEAYLEENGEATSLLTSRKRRCCSFWPFEN